MKPTRVLLTAASTLFVSQVMAGEAVFYITEDGTSMADVAVTVDGTKQLVGKSGFVTFDINSGTHSVELTQYGEWVGDFEFATQANAENAEIQVEVLGGEALEEVLVYTPGQEEAPALGQISGYLESDETGGAVTGARIAITGTEQAVMTDEEGFFAFELPRGEYDVTIAHPNYGKRDVSGVRVMSNVNTGVNLTMSMSGDGVIEEVVAVGSYIPSTATAQQRDASGVLDAIGSEQFSRFGDSNAASALKRVSGVTIAGGKYAVVRGLNERYTSVLFNGSLLPSPDPTRRVVPLDIFPSGIISSLNVEKTGAANRPADSAGATINVISREAPEEFEGKVSFGIEYADGTTGESFRGQEKTGLEIFGIGDSKRDLGSRGRSLSQASTGTALTGSDGADVADLGQWETSEIDIPVSFSAEANIGDLLAEYDFGTLSYKATARYANKWDFQESDRATYESLNSNTVREQDEWIESRAINNIDLSGAVTLSLVGAEYAVTSNTMILRNTQVDSTESVGVRGEDRYFQIDREHSWEERQFTMQQFVGDFQFPDHMDANVEWGLTYAKAELDSPDNLSYTLRDPSGGIDQDDSFNPMADNRYNDVEILFSSRPQRDFNELDDESFDLQLRGDIAAIEEDDYEVRVAAGIQTMSRERNVKSDSFIYNVAGGGFNVPSKYRDAQDISRVLNNASFAAGDFEVSSVTDPEASYKGEWDYTSYYLTPSVDFYDVVRVEAGLRSEKSEMTVRTSVDPNTGSRVETKVDDDDVYPSLSVNLTAVEDWQFRFSYYESVNRPDFREVAPTIFKDTVSGDTYRGNPNLVEASVDNFDLRAEYYFSDNESVTVGLFRKDIEKAIERDANIVSGSSNSVIYGFDNNGDAYAQGIEITAAKDFDFESLGLRVSGNASIFDTEIEIFNNAGQLDKKRDLQGQPELLANLQVALDEFESGREYTLVINHTGESLYAVSADDSLDDEKRLARTVVDFNFKQPIADQFAVKAELGNLLDSDVEQQQGGNMTRRYSPGRSISVGMSYDF
ncbi:MAG: TonB-dependent receptor [Oceanobacter sp.]